MTGRIHSIQTFSTLDGPGIRCVAFLQGCPLRCLYCHNPDTHDPRGGREVSAHDLMDEVLRCQPYFGPHGGLTLSGGEPLLQSAFAAQVFRLCRRYRVHAALDTSGCLLDEPARQAVGLADLVLLDVKHTDPRRHRELTGFSLEQVLDFLTLLDELGKPFWVRQVIVPGWNDAQSDAVALAQILRPHRTLERVELLPFRKLGAWKYRQLGCDFALADTPEADPARAAELESIVRQALARP